MKTRRNRSRLVGTTVVGVVGALLVGVAPGVWAVPIDLDRSFGPDRTGIVLTPIGLRATAETVVLQPDGKIVAAGEGGNSDFALVRYNPDGTPDHGFGAGGIVTTPVGLGGGVESLALQPDGKLVAAGTVAVPPPGAGDVRFAFGLARYNADGTLDGTFGTGGTVVHRIGERSFAREVLLQPDGKVIVVGDAVGVDASDQFALARYKPDGTLDPTFGTGGIALSPGSGVTAAVLQPDGKVVLTARFRSPVAAGGIFEFKLVRYNPNGSLDPTFGTGGQVTTRLGDNAEARALILQPDGRLIAVGEAEANGTGALGLARYNPDGTLDPGFGTGGVAFTPFGAGFAARAAVLQPDGRIAVVGGRLDGFSVARYSADGRLEGDRPVTTIGTFASAQAAVLQPDGRLVAAGFGNAGQGSNTMFALVRYDLGPGAVTATDLGLAKTASSFTVRAGKNLTYFLTVTNHGGLPAPATVVETLPGAITFRWADRGCTGPPVGSSGTVVCTLGDVAPGASRTVAIGVKARTAGLVTNTATVSTPAIDTQPANDSVSATIVVTAGKSPSDQDKDKDKHDGDKDKDKDDKHKDKDKHDKDKHKDRDDD